MSMLGRAREALARATRDQRSDDAALGSTAADYDINDGNDKSPPGRAALSAARAATVLAECDEVAGAADGLTAAQASVLEVYRGLCRRYAARGDALLWQMPQFLREEIARWKGTHLPG